MGLAKGLRRSEIGSIMRLAPAQIKPLLLSVKAFLTTQTGHFNFQSQSLSDAIGRRYLPTTDAQFEAHKHLAEFFKNPDNATEKRRVDIRFPSIEEDCFWTTIKPPELQVARFEKILMCTYSAEGELLSARPLGP